jgi:hypothetical protein
LSEDIVKPLGSGETCKECGSELPMHFGDCSQHPTKQALSGRKRDEPDLLVPPSTTTPIKPPVDWLKGAEMKVTEDFLKFVIGNHTGSVVKSVKFKGKQFVVVFE